MALGPRVSRLGARPGLTTQGVGMWGLSCWSRLGVVNLAEA